MSLFTAALFQGHPFSRSYGVILPSSLTMLLPSALGFSPHPPVSVYGTGTCQTIAAFLGTWLTHFATLFRSASRLWVGSRFCLEVPSSACARLSFPRLCSPHASPQFCCHAVQESQDLPREDQLYPGNLGYSAERIPTSLSLLIPAFSLGVAPRLLPVPLRRSPNAPLPMYEYIPELRCRVSAPDIFGAGPLDQ